MRVKEHILSFPLYRFPMGNGHWGDNGSAKAAGGIRKSSGLLPGCRIPAPALANGERADDGGAGAPVYWPQHAECTEAAGPGEQYGWKLSSKEIRGTWTWVWMLLSTGRFTWPWTSHLTSQSLHFLTLNEMLVWSLSWCLSNSKQYC